MRKIIAHDNDQLYKGKNIITSVMLVGDPNCGKTAMFQILTKGKVADLRLPTVGF